MILKGKNTRRKQFLEVGFELFNKTGYNGVGIQEIADQMNASKGSFYNFFRKKEDFVLEILEDFNEEIERNYLSALTNKNLSPINRIIQFYENKADNIAKHIKSHEGCFIGNLCQEMSKSSNSIAKSTEKAFKIMTDAINDCLIEAQEKGELDAEIETRFLAEFIENSWGGALMRIKGSKNTEALDSFMYILKNKVF